MANPYADVLDAEIVKFRNDLAWVRRRIVTLKAAGSVYLLGIYEEREAALVENLMYTTEHRDLERAVRP